MQDIYYGLRIMNFCALYCLKYFLKVKTFVVYLQQNKWFGIICIIKVFVKFYTFSIYIDAEIYSKAVHIFKVFLFCTMAHHNLKIAMLRQKQKS